MLGIHGFIFGHALLKLQLAIYVLTAHGFRYSIQGTDRQGNIFYCSSEDYIYVNSNRTFFDILG